ncbi:MAG: enoyl-CoA hydratase/isomerase family protein [Ectothiorhodospiraceae bacterium]|nr:enoyl-CoA hydratase/isomerase family protein [Chromatiales bacterium]MCP5156037.1 enoyl-CoA hydratase/isomerase family protein [Ectothiorhodospiraceae bacterium]
MKRLAIESQLDFFDAGADPGTAWPQAYVGLPETEDALLPTGPGPDFDTMVETWFEPELGAYWAMTRQDAPTCFTPQMVRALRQGQLAVAARVRGEIASRVSNRLRYQVFGSRQPQVFSLGGDLSLFARLIRQGDRAGLLRYARECVDLVYATATAYGLPVTTIALVQGQALGGGFEAALAAQVVVAERHVKMGLPEVLFNMFPGMGAWQLLTRRLSPVAAERLISGGRQHDAAELHAMGLVDVLAESGEGEEAVRRFIRSHRRHARGRAALRRAIEASSPLDYKGMMRSVRVWVDAALELDQRDLEIMEYLLRAQSRLGGN